MDTIFAKREAKRTQEMLFDLSLNFNKKWPTLKS